MTVKKVERFATTDGLLFEDPVEANSHQDRLDLNLWYNDNQLTYDFGLKVPFDDLVNWLQTHPVKVRQLLKVY
jgi:hypothetical protein